MSRVVVIGAGVGGLATAARLSAAGHKVVVCERAASIGGKLGVAERVTPAGTFRFDTGPSLLTLPQVFADLFAETGEPMDRVLKLERVEPTIRYRFADGTRLDASSDLDTMCDNLERALEPGAGADWRALMTRAQRIWEATYSPILSATVDGPLSLLKRGVRVSDLASIAPGRTLRQAAARYVHDPRLQMLVERYATYAGSDPRRAPAAFLVIPYIEQAFGAWYIRGGLAQLADSLVDRVTELGGEVRTETDVAAIEVAGNRVAGVRLTDGERLAADVVVAGVDARHLYTDLLPSKSMQRRIERVPPSLAGFTMLFALRGETADVAQHNVIFPRDYDAEFDAIFGESPRPVTDPTIYVNVVRDPLVCPPYHEAWTVLVNAPVHGAVDWDSQTLRASYADRIAGALGARGLQTSGRTLLREVITPADLARSTRSPGGAIYGPSSNGTRAAFLRPPNRTAVPGLFHVGGSTHPGGGLPLAALSGQIVAGLIGPA
ncbi:MAG TPA: phytoene desaturase family protein [Mycobacteriales bacterium]|nr:phytoene desaturase family protein [Mycobacteriales bacterium]